MKKRNFREFFEDGWNKLFGKEEDKSKLRTQSLYRAQKGPDQNSRTLVLHPQGVSTFGSLSAPVLFLEY